MVNKIPACLSYWHLALYARSLSVHRTPMTRSQDLLGSTVFSTVSNYIWVNSSCYSLGLPAYVEGLLFCCRAFSWTYNFPDRWAAQPRVYHRLISRLNLKYWPHIHLSHSSPILQRGRREQKVRNFAPIFDPRHFSFRNKAMYLKSKSNFFVM